MSDMEDYGFEYSEDEYAEEDVDIENQYYNSKGGRPAPVPRRHLGSHHHPLTAQVSLRRHCRPAGERRFEGGAAGLPAGGEDGA